MGSLIKQCALFRSFLAVLPPPYLIKNWNSEKNLDTRVQLCLWGEGRGWACLNWETPQKCISVQRLLSMIVAKTHIFRPWLSGLELTRWHMKEEKALGFHNAAFDCINEVFLSFCHSKSILSSQRYFEGPHSVSREPGFPLRTPGLRIFEPNKGEIRSWNYASRK